MEVFFLMGLGIGLCILGHYFNKKDLVKNVINKTTSRCDLEKKLHTWTYENDGKIICSVCKLRPSLKTDQESHY